MSLAQRIYRPLFGLLLVLGVVLVYLAVQFYFIQNNLQRTLTAVEQISQRTRRLDALQKSIEADILAYRLSHDLSYAEGIRRESEEIDSIIESLMPAPEDEEYLRLVRMYAGNWESLRESQEAFLTASARGWTREAEQESWRWLHKAELLDASLADLQAYDFSSLGETSESLSSSVRMLSAFSLLITLASAAFIVLLSRYLSRVISRPAEQLVRYASRLASRDFSSNPPAGLSGEFGTLGQVLHQMASQLQLYYKSLEGEVERKSQELELHIELERKQNEFISIASHELKTPVTSQRLFIELLEQMARERGHAEYAYYLSKVGDQSKKLANLVNDLLDVARIEGKKLVLERKPFDLNDCVRKAVEEQQMLSKHRIELREEVGSLEVLGDRERISQVIFNLLSNAVKYSPHSDRVVVRIGIEEGEAKVSVQDFGIGIAPEHQLRIFERFFRVGGASEKMFPGMGVGLYICSEIIKNHEGRIWVESSPGGSTFHFRLPRLSQSSVHLA